MRTYVIDELRPEETQKVVQALKDQGCKSPMKDIFWLSLPNDLLDPVQREHLPGCGPYFLSLEIERDSLHLELLVRAENKIRCNCVQFVSPDQRNFILEWLDALMTELQIGA